MRKEDLRTILFAGIVCIICSLLLSATAASLKAKQNFNRENDRKLNVLKAFGTPTVDQHDKKISGEKITALFKEYIHEIVIDPATGKEIQGLTIEALTEEDIKQKIRLPLYMWEENNNITKYAFPASGMGLWSTGYSYIALNEDVSSIVGVTFFGHKETPGLGGECSTDWFQDQFKDKKVWENGKPLSFEVVKGGVLSKHPQGNDHAVDAISGATMTGVGIEQFINQALESYGRYFDNVRRGAGTSS